MDCYDDECAVIGEMFFLLSNYRRRVVIRYVDCHGLSTLREIATIIAELEDSKQKTVYVNLYQSHAPQLADQNVVTYDSQAKTVSKGARFDCCVELLDCATRVA